MEHGFNRKEKNTGAGNRKVAADTFIPVLALLIFSLCLGACGMIKEEKDIEQKKAETEAWLNEKYEESFRVLSVQTADVLTEYDTYRVIREGTDEDTDWFTVRGYEDRKSSGESYEDDYFGILIRSEMEQIAAELPLWEQPVKVYIKQFFFPGSFHEFGSADTLEYAKTTEAALDADYYIFLNAEAMDLDDFYAKTEELFQTMSAANQPGLIRVYGLNEQAFLEVDRRNCEVFLQDYYRADGEKCLALARRVIKKHE